MIQATQETNKDEIEQAYVLLLAAKKQIEADEKEIERLRERNMILDNFINELRRGAIAEYQLRVSAEQTLRQMVNELKALDLGDSETRIRIYHVLNKYKLL